MKAILRIGAAGAVAVGFVLLPAIWGQAPQAHSDAIGFSYSLPEDWQVVKPAPPPPQPKLPANAPAEVKRGIACIEIPLTARRGEPVSSVVIVALPFNCFGQTITENDLPGFGLGVTDGLKQTFDFATPPLTMSYKLAGHPMWVERVKTTPKGKTAPVFTVEIACTLLKKGAVCWLAQVADIQSLEAFERSAVTLEGTAVERLVPQDVFVKSQ